MGILTNLSLFSGAGGLDLGAKLVGGFRTVCYVENDPYAQGVLMSRMRDGGLDRAPIWDDVTTFDGKPWRGRVDIVSGGFPCQDVSVAGKRAGLQGGTRSGLWFQFARIIGEVVPRCVLLENVPGLIYTGGIGEVLGSLADLGFNAQWQIVSAADVGAYHLRERVWIVANSNKSGWSRWRVYIKGGPWSRQQFEGLVRSQIQLSVPAGKRGRISDGVALRPYRLRCTGNGVVPQQSAPAWQKIKEMSGDKHD